MPRAADTHKWHAAVAVVAGSPGMSGAARLVTAAAMRTGAGYVRLSTPGGQHDPGVPTEAVTRSLPPASWAATVTKDLDRFKALVVGPGLGRSDATTAEVRELVAEAQVPVVVDGDGLFALAWSADGAASLLRNRPGPTVLTPHDGEFALLAGRKPGADRLAAARELATATGAVVLLKGPATVVAEPAGRRAALDGRRRAAGHGRDRGCAVRDRRRPARAAGPGVQGRRGRRLAARARRGERTGAGARGLGPARAAAGRPGVPVTVPLADPRRQAWVEVDLGAIAANVGVLAETVAPAALWVVVKADGYGHGAAPVARAALEAGAEGLCVALVQEGVALRQAGILAPVLVLSEQPEDQLDELVRWRLTATVYSLDHLEALAHEAREAGGATVRVHLKVDTGMHRVGARTDELVPLVQALLARPELRWEGLWTHLARADETRVSTTVTQLARLDAAIGVMQEAGYPPPLVHAANSAGALGAGPAARRDMVRSGIAVYGIPPGPEVAAECAELQPALSLRACVTHVQRVPPGEGISLRAPTRPRARDDDRHAPARLRRRCTPPAGGPGRRGAARWTAPSDRRGPSPWINSWSTAVTTSSRRATRRC